MESIRRNVFETNSSSTHSLTMCSETEYEKWKKGELLFHKYDEEFVTKEEFLKIYQEIMKKYFEKYPDDTEEDFKDYMGDNDYLTYDEFWDYFTSDYETFQTSYTTKNGEKVISFGYYGYDG